MAKLEEHELKPALPADKKTWIRRATFDVIGLPPTPDEIQSFLSDDSTDAYQKVVDRLLASPHYGERWGRHWLDLVRFAETNGHEYDNTKLDAWRYRDYVIRAFNRDVPYNQFVKEHIAGDLIPEKRLSPDGAYWESPIGTSFYWFGEVLNSATDSVKSRADQVDNQIDVTSKAFLGLTTACARCHDHKFDPIPTADYYALAGIMHSTDITESVIDSPVRSHEIASIRQSIAGINERIRRLLWPAQLSLAKQLGTYLLAAAEVLVSPSSSRPDNENRAEATGLNPVLLKAWTRYLEQARQEPGHAFYPFVSLVDRLAKNTNLPVAEAVARVREDLEKLASPLGLVQQESRGDIVYEDFEKSNYEGWTVSGQAFSDSPSHRAAPNQKISGYPGQGLANSFGGGSDRLVGSLTSGKFKMPKLYLHVRLAGTKLDRKEKEDEAELRLTVVADGHKSQHFLPEGNTFLEWKTLRMTKEIGRMCYFEIVDRSRAGHIVVDKIVLSDSAKPPILGLPFSQRVMAMVRHSDLTSLKSLAQAYQEMTTSALMQKPTPDYEMGALIEASNPMGKLEDLAIVCSAGEQGQLAKMQKQRADLEADVPESTFAMIAKDDNPGNIRIHIRGNHKNLGQEVPRRFLQIVAGSDQPPFARGSGRLELAEWMVSPKNPLTPRVMANRVWKYYFGRGLVSSVDNFGKTGERPTHAELLDFLAERFVESGWSVKALHRMILSSSTYRMSSRESESAARIDPQNKLLHRMPVRRLEAEAIRDSILAVAGTLDGRLFGPSVAPYISEYQNGRGKPESGPLDGNRRRSIYVQVRRNFLTPMFLAFDYPLPISTIGNRSASTVPSQALMMMNNEFVVREAQEWARQLTAAGTDPRQRVKQMYLTAYSRAAENWEITEILQFIASQKSRYELLTEFKGPADQQAWTDLCHVLLNSAEFIYVR